MEDKKWFSVMLDMSRNGVMTVNEIKKYALLISKMGYNMLQLYMEDVYEIEGEPYFGYMRGRYTQKELKEIVLYCNSIGMEVVPCMQTLAHLENALRWQPYKDLIDYDNILLVGDERTYTLIDKMFKTLRECFTTEYIHIGMDEAYMLGLGKYREIHGYENRVDILSNHLSKVMDLAGKYNFKPMMWSDMFFRLANNGCYYPKEPTLTQEVIDKIPQNLGLVYWDYFTQDEDYYIKMMKAHLLAGDNVWFAGGAWTWAGFGSGNKFALDTIVPAMKSAAKCGLKNILFTLWGDCGRECSYYEVLPALFTAKKIYEGETDIEIIKREFKNITGEDYDSMMDFDIPNYVGGNKTIVGNVCKQMFYSDPFLGYLDSTVKKGVEKEYKNYAKILREHKINSKFDYIFESSASLCDFLSIKYSIGKRTREAYQAHDMKQLEKLVKDYSKLVKLLDIFYTNFKIVWDTECKPNGFETHDIKMGGLKQRIISCRKKLMSYINGEIKEIPELEIKLLDYMGNGDKFSDEVPYLTPWGLSASVSQIL